MSLSCRTQSELRANPSRENRGVAPRRSRQRTVIAWLGSGRVEEDCQDLPLATRNSQLATRNSAFTLVEVLIVITIIATLSAAFLGISGAATESSRESRTKGTIGKINTLLMEKWATYATRRVDISSNELTRINLIVDRRVKGQELALARLLATRELMKFEMPDRWSDILNATASDILPNAAETTFKNISSVYTAARPSITNQYLRHYRRVNPSDAGVINKNQGAECLYMVIMLNTGDGEARTMFSDNSIGDTDGDGALEFLDGWGRPIQWIRWPVGFVSDLMPYDPAKLSLNPAVPALEARYYEADHDPFDIFRLEEKAFRIVPLIYSAGSDGILDVSFVQTAFASVAYYSHAKDVTRVDITDADSNLLYIGTQRDRDDDGEDNSSDNIHNHLLGN